MSLKSQPNSGAVRNDTVATSVVTINRNNRFTLSCTGAILKNQPVCDGTSRLKIQVCAVTRYALLKTPTLKSNKR